MKILCGGSVSVFLAGSAFVCGLQSQGPAKLSAVDASQVISITIKEQTHSPSGEDLDVVVSQPAGFLNTECDIVTVLDLVVLSKLQNKSRDRQPWIEVTIEGQPYGGRVRLINLYTTPVITSLVCIDLFEPYHASNTLRPLPIETTPPPGLAYYEGLPPDIKAGTPLLSEGKDIAGVFLGYRAGGLDWIPAETLCKFLKLAKQIRLQRLFPAAEPVTAAATHLSWRFFYRFALLEVFEYTGLNKPTPIHPCQPRQKIHTLKRPTTAW